MSLCTCWSNIKVANIFPSYFRTFSPVWDVFKSSTEKLASCHLELVRKLQELIKEVQKYGDEQIKAHKKVICTFKCILIISSKKLKNEW